MCVIYAEIPLFVLLEVNLNDYDNIATLVDLSLSLSLSLSLCVCVCVCVCVCHKSLSAFKNSRYDQKTNERDYLHYLRLTFSLQTRRPL